MDWLWTCHSLLLLKVLCIHFYDICVIHTTSFPGGITVSIIAFVFTIKFLCELAARVVSFLQNEDPGRRGDRSIYDYVRGNYLDPRSCKVSWDWKEPQEVGQTMSFRVQVGGVKWMLHSFLSQCVAYKYLKDFSIFIFSSSIKMDSLFQPTGLLDWGSILPTLNWLLIFQLPRRFCKSQNLMLLKWLSQYARRGDTKLLWNWAGSMWLIAPIIKYSNQVGLVKTCFLCLLLHEGGIREIN